MCRSGWHYPGPNSKEGLVTSQLEVVEGNLCTPTKHNNPIKYNNPTKHYRRLARQEGRVYLGPFGRVYLRPGMRWVKKGDWFADVQTKCAQSQSNKKRTGARNLSQ